MAIDEVDIQSGTIEELAQTVTDAEKRELIHTVQDNAAACFTWDYERSRDQLVKLYEKAKTSMWNASTDIDWDIDVDPWKIAAILTTRSTRPWRSNAAAHPSRS